MKMTLINFGTSTRVVHDVANRPVVIDIGKTADVVLHETTMNLIRKGMQTGDLLVMVPNYADLPSHMKKVMHLLSGLDSEPETEMLTAINEVLGVDAEVLRPNREQMRKRLRDECSRFLDQNVAAIANALRGNETPAPSRTDDMDDAMRTALGNDAGKGDDAPKVPKKKKTRRAGRKAAARKGKTSSRERLRA